MFDSIYGKLNTVLSEKGDFNAVISENGCMKLSRLLELSGKLASYLSLSGIKPGDNAAILLSNSSEFVIAVYALDLLGTDNLIIPYNESLSQINELIEANNIKFVITDNEFSEKLNVKSIILDNCSFNDYDVAEPRGTGNFLLFGGGTTGERKISLLPSKCFNRLSDNLSFVLEGSVYGKEAYVAALPFSHIFGLAVGLHFMLCHGFTVVIPEKFSPMNYALLTAEYKATFASGVPDMFRKILREPDFKCEYFSSLKYVFCGGDFCPVDLIDKMNICLKKAGSSASFYVGYGLTEAASVCTVNSGRAHKPGSAGKPIDNTAVRIIDKVDGTGEICVKSECVFSGYTDGTYPITDDGWLKTGDVGCLDDEGFLYVSGRKKRIAVVSGYNVYLSQIEEIIGNFSEIDEAAVISYTDNEKTKLAAFAAVNRDVTESFISEELKNKLSGYCMPSKVIIMNSLPHNINGKIDYNKLNLMIGDYL